MCVCVCVCLCRVGTSVATVNCGEVTQTTQYNYVLKETVSCCHMELETLLSWMTVYMLLCSEEPYPPPPTSTNWMKALQVQGIGIYLEEE